MANNVKPEMGFFDYQHLPDRLQEVSRPFYSLANQLDFMLPEGSEKDICLRKLLEAKDCAVRSLL